MLRGWRLATCLLLLAAAVHAVAGPAQAEHTSDHRYFFVGSVTTTAGESVCGLEVRAYMEEMAGSPDMDRSAPTDWNGRYAVQLHMHSGYTEEAQPSDSGKTVIVTIDSVGVNESVIVTPNDLNPQGWGQLTVDLEVPDTVKSTSLCLKDVAIYSGVGVGGTAAAVGGIWYVRKPRGGTSRGRRDLMRIPGVTRAKARELEGAGVRSAEDLAEANPSEIASKSNLTAKQARSLVKRAQEQVAGKKG